MARFKDKNWELPALADGRAPDWDTVRTAIFMDIRDHLQTLVNIFQCSNFTGIPHQLSSIAVNTRKPKRKGKQ